MIYMNEVKVLKMRQGKPGGGKGALIGTEVSFTLATSQDQTLFQPVEPDMKHSSNTLNPWDPQSKRVYTTDDVGPTLCARGRPREDAGPNVITGDNPYAVRRLMPVECERLQGFPDGWTDVPYKGKEHPPDGARYKALGNSMAVPVMRWIGERMQVVDEIMRRVSNDAV